MLVKNTIGIAFGLILLASLLYWFFTKENFYSTDYYPKNVNYTGDDTDSLSHGTVQKTLLQDGEYFYDYFYNLPNPFSDFQSVRPGVLFNNSAPKRKYEVLLGQTKDSVSKIGELTRRGDGYHVFELKTKEDYKVSCISLDGKIIHCVDL